METPRITIPGLKVTNPKAFRAWLESTDHLYNCIGDSEGMMCCLEHLLEPGDER